jgi:hypothetical protein
MSKDILLTKPHQILVTAPALSLALEPALTLALALRTTHQHQPLFLLNPPASALKDTL